MAQLIEMQYRIEIRDPQQSNYLAIYGVHMRLDLVV